MGGGSNAILLEGLVVLQLGPSVKPNDVSPVVESSWVLFVVDLLGVLDGHFEGDASLSHSFACRIVFDVQMKLSLAEGLDSSLPGFLSNESFGSVNAH